MTDFDDEGNYAWKKGAYAASAYRFSKKAAPHKHLKDYNKVLHVEHVIPLSMVFKRWLELIDEGVSPQDQRAFLEHHLEVVWITVAEQQKVGLATTPKQTEAELMMDLILDLNASANADHHGQWMTLVDTEETVRTLMRRTHGSTLLNLDCMDEKSSVQGDKMSLMSSKVVDVPSQCPRR